MEFVALKQKPKAPQHVLPPDAALRPEIAAILMPGFGPLPSRSIGASRVKRSPLGRRALINSPQVSLFNYKPHT